MILVFVEFTRRGYKRGGVHVSLQGWLKSFLAIHL